jgi:hypothetical protein
MAEDCLDALFFYVYLSRFKTSPSPLVTTGIQVVPRYFRNSSLHYNTFCANLSLCKSTYRCSSGFRDLSQYFVYIAFLMPIVFLVSA